ncbi:ornithine--oxo-acid aminotransferase [Candidatus Paracaedibacter acanthamoebae]|uniref:ornithine aminotransferase n=2 Tax=Candidatus Odyssella acanthamoebae TaxID=91604 RepID=A0A077AWX9_9PROT|nr:ornithine--oxo-acid aminotransferase [Candidatus Paracaedibacter acanthamoebae]
MMESQDYMDLEDRWGAHNYHPLPVVLCRGEGVWLWDVTGKKYLDMMSAYSAVSHGHSHPRLVSTMIDQVNRLAMCSRAYHNDVMPRFLETVCKMTGMDRMLPMNTGAEAVETAIKAVRRWGYQVKGIPTDQAEIIVTSQNFHGRTIGIISFSSDKDYQKGFGPFLAGFKSVPFGDAIALEKAITPNTCAVLTEPIQGEAGIVMPPKGWLKQVSAICKKNNVMLVVDEVQSGLGRTGKILACEHEDVSPDAVILGKALGGGLFPVSGVAGKRHLMDVFNPGSHGSTFGGNPLGAAIAIKALELLEEDQLCERSQEMGAYLTKQLQSIDSKMVKDIRGIGLWIGLEINPKIAAARQICEKLAKLGVLSKETHETVVRLAPPLVITKEEIDWGINRIRQVLTES